MAIEENMISYLRNMEVTEPELLKIYRDFGRLYKNEGFVEGCEFIRGAINKQKAARRQFLKDRYKDFLMQLDDYINGVS